MRATALIKPWEAFDIFDLSESLGIEVRFAKIASMEGMYIKRDVPILLVAAERPTGRQRFTCAHELAHHVFSHGSRIDELFEPGNPGGPKSQDELLADMFAGFLLMPKSAVNRAFAVRGQNMATCEPRDVFGIANWLGVGYATLVNHLHYGLNLIPHSRLQELTRQTPKSIREHVLGSPTPNDLIVVDSHWTGRPIDVQVDDLVLAPENSRFEGRAVDAISKSRGRMLFQARAPGVGRLSLSGEGWASFLRVSRKHFEGRSVFRHLEEVEDD